MAYVCSLCLFFVDDLIIEVKLGILHQVGRRKTFCNGSLNLFIIINCPQKAMVWLSTHTTSKMSHIKINVSVNSSSVYLFIFYYYFILFIISIERYPDIAVTNNSTLTRLIRIITRLRKCESIAQEENRENGHFAWR